MYVAKALQLILILLILTSFIEYLINEFEFYIEFDISLSLTVIFQKANFLFENKCVNYFLQILVDPNYCKNSKVIEVLNQQ